MSNLEPVYLVLGTDTAKVARVVSRLRSHFPDEIVEHHPAASGSAKELFASFQTLGLLAEQRLVIATAVQEWKADDVNILLDYLKQPADDVVLLLIADKLAANSRFRKAFKKPRLIECAGPESVAELRAWVGQLFAEEQTPVDRNAVDRLIELCCGIELSARDAMRNLDSNDLLRLRSDVERIATYANKEPVTVAIIDELATRTTDEKVWLLGDAWARGDRSGFLRLVEQLLDQREHPVRLASSVARHLHQVNDAHHLLKHNSADQTTKQLVAQGANAWGAKKVVQQAQRVRGPRIDAALARIAMLDSELKGGNPLGGRIAEDSSAGDRIVLERGLLELI